MTTIYVAYLYCDYRKEVDLQHIKAFTQLDEAITFVQRYANPEYKDNDYVLIKGTEFDAPFFEASEQESIENGLAEEEFQQLLKKEELLRKELNVKKGMWSLRIAVDKVSF